MWDEIQATQSPKIRLVEMLTKGMIRINEAIPDDYGLAKGFDVLVNFFPTTTPFLALI